MTPSQAAHRGARLQHECDDEEESLGERMLQERRTAAAIGNWQVPLIYSLDNVDLMTTIQRGPGWQMHCAAAAAADNNLEAVCRRTL